MKHKRTSRHFPAEPISLYADNQRSEHTAKNARYRLLAFTRWLEETHHVTDLEKVQTAHILSYKQALAHLAPSSQARAIETLRGFFRWAFAERLIDHDPAAQVKAPRPTLNKEPEYLTTDETRKLIASVDSHSLYAKRDRALLWTLAYGLRVGEVAGLNVGDVILPQNGKLPALRVTGKGTRQRIIPIAETALKAIRGYLAERKAAPSEPLFVCIYHSESNRRMTTRAIQKRFKAACGRAKIATDKAHPHAARHGAAQRWLYESSTPGGVYTVSRLLGHGSIATTEKYLHLNREALESAVLGDPLNSKR